MRHSPALAPGASVHLHKTAGRLAPTGSRPGRGAVQVDGRTGRQTWRAVQGKMLDCPKGVATNPTCLSPVFVQGSSARCFSLRFSVALDVAIQISNYMRQRVLLGALVS